MASILLLEDAPADAELAERELRRAGLAFTAHRVETEAAFRAALTDSAPDLILSDFSLPQFTGLDALRLAREFAPDVPVILVTGSLTEELAVECMRAGATDYILKNSLTRLPAAVVNALDKAETQRAKEAATAALQRSEEQYRELFENAHDLIYTHDLAGNFTSLNKTGERLTGYTRAEVLRMNVAEMLTPEQLTRGRMILSHTPRTDAAITYDMELATKTGQRISLELSLRLIHQDGRAVGVQGIGRDVTERRRTEAERQVMFKITQGMGTTANLNELLQLIHESIGKVLNAENCFVALHDQSTQLLSMQFFVDKHDSIPPPQNVGKGRTAYVFRTGQPILMTPELLAGLIAQGEVTALGTAPAAWLGVPLRTPAATIGVLVVQHYEDAAAFSARDLEFLASVGGQVALAIERKRADEALRASDERYRAFVENISEAIWRFESEQPIPVALPVDEQIELFYQHAYLAECNDVMAQMYGFTQADEFVGSRLNDLMPREQAGSVAALRAFFGAGYRLLDLETEEQDRHGRPRYFLNNLVGIVEAGHLLRVWGTQRDITARKQAEAERDAERDLLNVLIERLPVGVLLRDEQGRYTRANQRAAQILEIDREALIGARAEDVIHMVQLSDADGQLLAATEIPSAVAIQTQQPFGPLQETITTPAGNRRRLIVSAAPVALSEQGAPGSVVVLDDVTEQYALQEQLRQAQKMESIGLLAGGVAHDFNNLLTAIQGNTQLAMRRVEPADPVHQRLLEVEKAAQRAALLTRQLLAFSRRQYLERKPVKLNDSISDIMKMMRRIIGEDVEVRVHAAADLALVFADPTQLEQVIMNLAINARDAMPAGGLLVIETQNVVLDDAYCRRYSYVQPGRYVEIMVSDTGIGMDAPTQARIFEPFFTTKELGKGTGLGLAMAYGIVKQHDGHIHVYSEPGHGTTFKIYLPAHDHPAATEAATSAPPLAGGTETILIVEDEAALRELARDVLEGLGYNVLLACDGEAAVSLYTAEQGRIDLLLMDVVMPKLGGHEAYEQMRALGSAPPVIFMTGYSVETVQSKFVKHNDFIAATGATLLQKPYRVEGLGLKVRETLDAQGKQQGGRGEVKA